MISPIACTLWRFFYFTLHIYIWWANINIFYEIKETFAFSLYCSCIPTPIPTPHPTSLPGPYTTLNFLPASLYTPFNTHQHLLTVLNNRYMTKELYTSYFSSTPCQIASECKGHKTLKLWSHEQCPLMFGTIIIAYPHASVCVRHVVSSLVSNFSPENV